ncbi:phage integrase [Pseudoteredinibacter isoporae]|uniref:phage integrase n=1 Tax=Pseudoteredinibacter isoporae TaxID=570281 RepID=UPI00310A38BD
MQAKITARAIKSLAVETKPYEVVDTELKGFLLRVQPSGRMTFYYSYRNEAKKRKRIKIGQLGPGLSLAQARDEAIRIAGEVNQGKDVQGEKQSRRQAAMDTLEKTLSRFIEQAYEPWATSNLKSAKSSIDRVKYSFPLLLNIPMIEVTVSQLERWRTDKLNEGLKPSTINRCVNSLRAVLTKAVEWEVIEEHPLRKLKALPLASTPKVRYLSESEERRLLDALLQRDDELKEARSRGNEHRRQRCKELMPELSKYAYGDRMTPLVLLSLKTGMRRGELFDLEWHSINLEQKIVTVVAETAKSKKSRHIPLSPTAIEALRNWQKQAPSLSGRVFPSGSGGRLDNVRKSWASILDLAEITDFRWHDMRHDFASKLVMKGVPLNTVRELCGHADLNTTLRYAHLAPDHKADAIALIG